MPKPRSLELANEMLEMEVNKDGTLDVDCYASCGNTTLSYADSRRLLEFMIIHEGSKLFHWYKNSDDTLVLKNTETSEWCAYVFLDGGEVSYMVNATAAAAQGENQMFVHRMCKQKVKELTNERQKHN